MVSEVLPSISLNINLELGVSHMSKISTTNKHKYAPFSIRKRFSQPPLPSRGPARLFLILYLFSALIPVVVTATPCALLRWLIRHLRSLHHCWLCRVLPDLVWTSERYHITKRVAARSPSACLSVLPSPSQKKAHKEKEKQKKRYGCTPRPADLRNYCTLFKGRNLITPTSS